MSDIEIEVIKSFAKSLNNTHRGCSRSQSHIRSDQKTSRFIKT